MAKGKKYGGRKKGTPNKVTLAREQAHAAKIWAEGKLLGKEIMSDIANVVYGMAKRHSVVGLADEATPDDKRLFLELLKTAAAVAAAVAMYESPRLQSTTIRHEPADLTRLTDAEFAELERITAKATGAPGDLGRNTERAPKTLN